MYKKDKDYRFSFKKYQIACAKSKVPMGDWAQKVNGAKVLIKRDRTEGLIHGNIVTQGQVVNINGMQAQMPGSKERVCYMVDLVWCEEA